jgi:hypothetical protein
LELGRNLAIAKKKPIFVRPHKYQILVNGISQHQIGKNVGGHE